MVFEAMGNCLQFNSRQYCSEDSRRNWRSVPPLLGFLNASLNAEIAPRCPLTTALEMSLFRHSRYPTIHYLFKNDGYGVPLAALPCRFEDLQSWSCPLDVLEVARRTVSDLRKVDLMLVPFPISSY